MVRKFGVCNMCDWRVTDIEMQLLTNISIADATEQNHFSARRFGSFSSLLSPGLFGARRSSLLSREKIMIDALFKITYTRVNLKRSCRGQCPMGGIGTRCRVNGTQRLDKRRYKNLRLFIIISVIKIVVYESHQTTNSNTKFYFLLLLVSLINYFDEF